LLLLLHGLSEGVELDSRLLLGQLMEREEHVERLLALSLDSQLHPDALLVRLGPDDADWHPHAKLELQILLWQGFCELLLELSSDLSGALLHPASLLGL